ncbi:MAG: anthranilate synthase component I [Candidatus Binatia bacterium]
MNAAAGAIRPTYEDFVALARRGNVVPISCEILGDLETPVSAFLKIHRGRYGFLLESVQGGEKWGRYSFLGSEPERTWTACGHVVEVRTRDGAVERHEVPDVLAALRDWLHSYRPVTSPGLPRFSGGAVGYLGYDLVRDLERLPARARDDLQLPEVVLLLADRLLVFDNVTQKIQIIANLFLQEGMSLREIYDAGVAGIEQWLARLRGPLPERDASRRAAAAEDDGALRSNLEQAEYEAMVRRAKEYVHAGDVIQVVLAQRFEGELRAAPFDVYRSLRSINPSPYLFFLDLGDLSLAGASPEVMVRVEAGEVTVRPIAGTRPRGTVERDDLALEQELLNDPKEIAEHIMLVDLGRNDVGRVAAIGSVEVTERLVVERYSHVMHIVSNVRGRLAPGRDAFDAFRSTFPAGTLSGAPKVRAMEIIEELEPVRRGVYGGAVGYFDFSGNMDTGIAIRTVLFKNGHVFVQTGAGIVADSVPEREHLECLNKARGMFQALRTAEALAGR